jgi:hypothetical protein
MRRKTRKPFLKFRYLDIQFSEFIWSQEMPCFTRRAIGEALGYPIPEAAIDIILRKVPTIPCAYVVETTDHFGKKCKEKLYDLPCVLLIASHANTHLAEHVITRVWEFLNLWKMGELAKFAKRNRPVDVRLTHK